MIMVFDASYMADSGQWKKVQNYWVQTWDYPMEKSKWLEIHEVDGGLQLGRSTINE